MNDSQLLISTRQAAALLGVHESSVKRWSNAGTLPCSYTAGGHRRISVSDLVAFARHQEMDCALLPFGPAAEAVWHALTLAQDEDRYTPLVELAYGWLRDNQPVHFVPLVGLLQAEGIPIARVLDRLLGPILRRIGNDWHAGRVSVGDEHRMTASLQDVLAHIRLATTHPPLPAAPCALVGCADEVQHSLGAEMVRLILEHAGWNVIFLGADVPGEEFILQQIRYDVSLVCVSFLPPNTNAHARRLISLLSRLYHPDRPFHLVLGGSGIDADLAKETAPTPFASIQVFGQLEPFADWSTHLLAKPAADAA